jgi:hypothetical protein
MFMANSCLVNVVSVKFAAPLQLCKTTKQAVNLSVHQDDGCTRAGILEILETVATITEI